MAEYISGEETVKKIEEKLKVDDLMSLAEDVWTNNCLQIVLRAIMAVETADVQPTNRWISVNDALPIYDGLVLVVDKNNTIRLGMYTDLGWTSQFGNPMVAHITYWQPLPEPPKDGDTNG